MVLLEAEDSAFMGVFLGGEKKIKKRKYILRIPVIKNKNKQQQQTNQPNFTTHNSHTIFLTEVQSATSEISK